MIIDEDIVVENGTVQSVLENQTLQTVVCYTSLRRDVPSQTFARAKTKI